MKKVFKVGGMHCKSCELLLKDAVEEAGGKVLVADHAKGVLEVDGGEKLFAKIPSIVKKEGYSLLN